MSTLASERALLGACLLGKDSFLIARELIGERPVFPGPAHSCLWAFLEDWYTHRDSQPDEVYLKRQQTNDNLANIEELKAEACQVCNVDFHGMHILKAWQILHIHSLATSLVKYAADQDLQNIGSTIEELSDNIAIENTTRFTLTDVLNAPPPPPPLFTNGLARGHFGLFIGGDGIGKGFVLSDLLISLSTGQRVSIPTLANTKAPLRVFYLSYEDTDSILKWRFDETCKAAGLEASVWHDAARAGRLTFLCEPKPLFIQLGRDVPKPTPSLQTLKWHIIQNKIELAVIDPLSACAILQNENDNAAMNVVANGLRAIAAETGCAILLVHHTSKAGRSSSGNHQAARGGSALGGASRWCLQLTEDSCDSNVVVLDVSKNSYGKRIYGIMLARNTENGVLQEMSGEEIGKAKDRLLANVIKFVEVHPSLEINPNAVKNRKSEGAQQLIEAVSAKPKEVYEAIMRAINEGQLATNERKRVNGKGTYEVLVVPSSDDDSEDEYECLF